MPKLGLLLVLALIYLLLPWGASAMEPLNEEEMDSVQGQSGIAMATSNATLYSEKRDWAYQDTSEDEEKMEYSDIVSFFQMHSLEPFTLQVFENEQEMILLALEALAEEQEAAWDMDLSFDATGYVFAGHDLGSMHLESMGLEEFALYTTPSEALEGVDRSGVALQLDARASLDEFRWAYQNGEDNEEALLLGGVHLAHSFDNGDPQGLFSIGELDPYNENGDMDPAMFQVRQDEEERVFVRMDLPMEGSLRVEDVEMGQEDNLGPIHLEGMDVHHFQMDFKPFEE